MRKIAAAALAAIMALTASCSKNGDTSTAIPQRPAVTVETMAVGTSGFTEYVEVVGSLAPKHMADVKSEIPGVFKEVNVREWVWVEKGTVLARINIAEVEAIVKRAEAAEAAAAAALEEARVSSARADREFARIAKLREGGFVAEQQHDTAETTAAAGRARLLSAEAQLKLAQADLAQARARLDKGTIKAPIDGVVALRDVNVGDLASDTGAAKTLFRIVDNRVLDLTATVPSSEMALVKPGDRIAFTVDAYPDKTYEGRIRYINPSVDEADRSVKVLADVHNASGDLKGGLFVKGRIITGKSADILMIQKQALIGYNASEKKAAVFIANGQTASRVAVTTGRQAGESVEITSGLKPGQRLIVRGGFTLKDGDAIREDKGALK